MSKKAVYNLLTRAFLDPAFRQELSFDILAAARKLGEELTAEEVKEIERALEEEESKTMVGLDQRLSKSGVSLTPQSILRQRGGVSDKVFRVDDYRFKEERKRKVPEEILSGSNQIDNIDENMALDEDVSEPDYEVEKG